MLWNWWYSLFKWTRTSRFCYSYFVSGTIEEETLQALQNINFLVEATGGTLDDIVKCSVHLADRKDWDKYYKVYSEFFTGVRPARITVQSGLGIGIKIELDAIAVIFK